MAGEFDVVSLPTPTDTAAAPGLWVAKTHMRAITHALYALASIPRDRGNFDAELPELRISVMVHLIG
jgi:hypothetical protein